MFLESSCYYDPSLYGKKQTLLYLLSNTTHLTFCIRTYEIFYIHWIIFLVFTLQSKYISRFQFSASQILLITHLGLLKTLYYNYYSYDQLQILSLASVSATDNTHNVYEQIKSYYTYTAYSSSTAIFLTSPR